MSEPRRQSTPSLRSSSVFDDFQKEMDGLFRNFLGRARDFGGDIAEWRGLPRGVLNPAIDVTENDDAITVTAELPGLAEGDVEISLADNVLTIKGEKKHEHDQEKDDAHLIERSYGAFQRTIPVPDRVDVDAISADFDKGVLTVKMPKREEVKAAKRTISIGKQA